MSKKIENVILFLINNINAFFFLNLSTFKTTSVLFNTINIVYSDSLTIHIFIDLMTWVFNVLFLIQYFYVLKII